MASLDSLNFLDVEQQQKRYVYKIMMEENNPMYLEANFHKTSNRTFFDVKESAIEFIKKF